MLLSIIIYKISFYKIYFQLQKNNKIILNKSCSYLVRLVFRMVSEISIAMSNIREQQYIVK